MLRGLIHSEYILGEKGRKYINTNRESGASVIVPVSSDKYVAGIADEIIYLNETFSTTIL